MRLLRYIELKSAFDNGPALSKVKGYGGEFFACDGNEYWARPLLCQTQPREVIGARALGKSRCEACHSIVPTDINKFNVLANTGCYGPDGEMVDRDRQTR